MDDGDQGRRDTEAAAGAEGLRHIAGPADRVVRSCLLRALRGAAEGGADLDSMVAAYARARRGFPVIRGRAAPPYTRDIEAAASLVPAGRPWGVAHRAGALAAPGFGNAAAAFVGEAAAAFAATPALALCIAAIENEAGGAE